MTELKAKGPPCLTHMLGRTPSPASRSPSAGTPRRRLLPGPGEASGPPEAPTASGLPLSQGPGLIFPRPCQAPGPGRKTLDPESLAGVEGMFRGEAAEGAVRPPEKDGGLLDSVLDTLAAPGPEQAASPPSARPPALGASLALSLPDARSCARRPGVLPTQAARRARLATPPGWPPARKECPGLAPCHGSCWPRWPQPPWPRARAGRLRGFQVVELEEDDSWSRELLGAAPEEAKPGPQEETRSALLGPPREAWPSAQKRCPLLGAQGRPDGHDAPAAPGRAR